MSALLLSDDVHAPLPVQECRCPARAGKKWQIKILFGELSNVTLRIPQGGLCSLELMINGSTPTTHFPLCAPERGVVQRLAQQQIWQHRCGLKARSGGRLPITKPQPLLQSHTSVLMKSCGGRTHPQPAPLPLPPVWRCASFMSH